ncbi:high-potential iron-sulfur protein, partial [Acinetobacter baumannii]
MSGQFSRRQMLFLALAAGGVAPQVTLADTPPAKVSEKDSLAVALGYVADSKHIDKTKSPTYQAGSSCSNCS